MDQLPRDLPSAETMSAQIARLLGKRIVSGDFAPGETLPVESELCERLGVSRTVVREAVKRLAGKHLVQVSPKVGTTVLPFAAWNLLDRDVLTWRLEAQRDLAIVDEIFEVRLCFEPHAAFLAAQRANADERTAIQDAFDTLIACDRPDASLPEVAQADYAFHDTIVRASHNSLLVNLCTTLRTALRLPQHRAGAFTPLITGNLPRYGALRSAILDGNRDSASRAMEDLLHATHRAVSREARSS